MVLRRLLVAAALLVAGCNPSPGEEVAGSLHEVECNTEYLTVTHAADGSSMTEVAIQAELAADLHPTEHWRVTAVACDLAQTPPPITCAANQTCAPRPTSACEGVFAGITADGKVLARCGHRVEHRNQAGQVTSSELRKFTTVTFHIR